ncbi:DNA alkylation repair protein [Streptomyces sp. CHD11]|uniref:DNA alkylation repair protein n=1 Tax=Streptomyces sp. CHD11 TaxID=2741325 RepID=UPI001BFCB542|nr:DNA alkylation repair protein [Streptomyces sp. CHD11]MBT3152143.1 DNA alkylation repair protein [Streptomyces sp. CHD11]
MAGTTTLTEVTAELAALQDPKIRAVNEKHGDDHGVNLAKLRAVAKRLKTQQELARRLWKTGDARAIGIGERLEVLKDYPTSPGCTSPFAPVWISEMVGRREGT